MKPIILIPTYNERESIGELLEKLQAYRYNQNFEVLIIDDGSPDGTVEYVESQNYPWVEILKRSAKSGLGPAYRAGFDYVLSTRREITHVVTMDADGSHRVEDVKIMLDAVTQGREAILGTRWMPGGSVINRPLKRQLLSRFGTTYARIMLRMPQRDLTGGLRIYSRELLESIDLRRMQTSGYFFQIEMALAARAAGARLQEIPIIFVERTNGKSKMTREDVCEALKECTSWGITLRLRNNADKLHYVK